MHGQTSFLQQFSLEAYFIDYPPIGRWIWNDLAWYFEGQLLSKVIA